MTPEHLLKGILAEALTVHSRVQDAGIVVSQKTIDSLFEQMEELEKKGELTQAINDRIGNIVARLTFLAVAAEHLTTKSEH